MKNVVEFCADWFDEFVFTIAVVAVILFLAKWAGVGVEWPSLAKTVLFVGVASALFAARDRFRAKRSAEKEAA